MNQVRLAVIGAGVMGARHAELVCAHDACLLVGVCDTDPSRKGVADRCRVPFYTSAEELIERERPSGAIIATSNSQHAPVAEGR
jgi:predicted dehydrogenase